MNDALALPALALFSAARTAGIRYRNSFVNCQNASQLAIELPWFPREKVVHLPFALVETLQRYVALRQAYGDITIRSNLIAEINKSIQTDKVCLSI